LPSSVEQLHRDLSRRGLSILAVNIEESRSTVASWVKEKKITIPILLDPDGEVTRRYHVIATPTVLLIDRQGRQLGRVVGPRDWASPEGNALLGALLTMQPGP
jgi:alkyl hydroperoxide reductase subunit AhpC